MGGTGGTRIAELMAATSALESSCAESHGTLIFSNSEAMGEESKEICEGKAVESEEAHDPSPGCVETTNAVLSRL
eukprot:XP_001707553.1 Hypothetical protein GL50803_37636 [Giardia lamblia ATCC 50803]